MMRDVVWLGANTLDYPQGGGHLWAYINWALGLRESGCEVVWLEHADPTTDEAELSRLVASLKQRLARYGLAEAVALCSRGAEELPESLTAGLIPLAAAEEASLFLNMAYGSFSPDRFRRSALLDIDPGSLQAWMSNGAIEVPRHDRYFTIGENVGRADALFPNGGLEWHYTPPCVALDHWPLFPAPAGASFTTVTHWSAAEWFTLRGDSFANDKRTAFLPYLDLPRHTSVPLELALCLGADEQLRLVPHEAEERDRLTAQGWRVVHSQAVSATPWEYQHYIQASRGEFSCAKPSFVRLQTGWISDRTICYLASGRPAIVEHTGPSSYLPDAGGLFRFRNLDEAVQALETATADYDHHCRAARALAEEHFAAEKVVPRLLDRALDRSTARY